MKTPHLDVLIWSLIYGGAFMAMLGLWVMNGHAALGHGLAWGGALVMLVGVLLIWLRSRRGDEPGAPDEGSRR